jgi:hypothetical protein
MTGGKPEYLGINLGRCDFEHKQPHTDWLRLEPGSLPLNSRINVHYTCIRGWDSSVGIATCYGLDGPGIESR